MKRTFGIVNGNFQVIEVGTGLDITHLFRGSIIKVAHEKSKALQFDFETQRAKQVELSDVPTEAPVPVMPEVPEMDAAMALITNSAKIKPDDLEMSDIKWKYLVRSAVRGKNIMMVGPAGCGKTQAAKALPEATKREYS